MREIGKGEIAYWQKEEAKYYEPGGILLIIKRIKKINKKLRAVEKLEPIAECPNLTALRTTYIERLAVLATIKATISTTIPTSSTNPIASTSQVPEIEDVFDNVTMNISNPSNDEEIPQNVVENNLHFSDSNFSNLSSEEALYGLGNFTYYLILISMT